MQFGSFATVLSASWSYTWSDTVLGSYIAAIEIHVDGWVVVIDHTDVLAWQRLRNIYWFVEVEFLWLNIIRVKQGLLKLNIILVIFKVNELIWRCVSSAGN